MHKQITLVLPLVISGCSTLSEIAFTSADMYLEQQTKSHFDPFSNYDENSWDSKYSPFTPYKKCGKVWNNTKEKWDYYDECKAKPYRGGNGRGIRTVN